MPMIDPELAACTPEPLNPNGFNPSVVLPYGLDTNHIKVAMEEFLGFLGFINVQLRTRDVPRLESFLMPANFSSLVGEFMNVAIPKYCPTLVKNRYHNGHPDLIPAGMFPNNAAQHAQEGIEVKSSRYAKGWQGHNAEAVWLLVFSFEANSASDLTQKMPTRPFRFIGVFGAKLEVEDWSYSGRKATSRRTITASVKKSGMEKMQANWIYKVSQQTNVDMAIPPVEET
jgi:hypothetical protein